MAIVWFSKESNCKVDQYKRGQDSDTTKCTIEEGVKISSHKVIGVKPSSSNSCERENENEKCGSVAVMFWI
jgi:hypothetical protein